MAPGLLYAPTRSPTWRVVPTRESSNMSESAPETGDVEAEQMLAEALAEPEQDQPESQQQPEAEVKPDTGDKTEADIQAELNKWRSMARKHEANAKANAEYARKYREYEESQKSEQQKLMERLEAAERERDEERRGRARLIAAATHNLSPTLLDRLGGSTEDEINETAEALSSEIEAEVARRLPDLVAAEVAKRLADMPQAEPTVLARQRPVEALTPGAMPANAEPVDGNSFLRRMAGREL